MAWTEEAKEQLIKQYLAAEPTAATTTEIIKELAEEFEQSANSVRMVLTQSKHYVKKEPAVSEKTTKAAKDGDAPKRVSKEVQLAALRAAIEGLGAEIDEEILEKMTGKAAAYFTTVLASK